MIGLFRRSNVFPAQILLVGLIVSVSVFFVAGCGLFSSSRKETNQLYKNVDGPGGSLIKNLVFLPIENNVPWSNIDLDVSYPEELKGVVEKESGRVRVLLPGAPDYPAGFKQLPYDEDGDMDNYTLAVAGQVSGVNMVLKGRLVGIRHIIKDTGMLWFAKQVHLARLQMETTVFHTGTGAKLLDKTVFQNVEITEEEGNRIKKQEMPNTVSLSETMTKIAEATGESIGQVLKHIPWEGYIKSAEGDHVVLSFGEASGLRKGRNLKVYRVDTVTEGRAGRRFFVQGEVVGRITITAVYPDRCEAVVKNGGPFPAGSVVRAD